MRVTVVVFATSEVVTLKLAEVAPAGIVQVLETLALGELLERVKTTPPRGAGPLRFAVTVIWLPPFTLVGPVMVKPVKLGVQISMP